MMKLNGSRIMYKGILILILFALMSIFKGYSQMPDAPEHEPLKVLNRSEEDSTVWFDPRDEPFNLIGFEWINKDTIFRRLPVQPKWEIRKPVDGLANNTAGGQVRFVTNSKKILIEVELDKKSGMYHMPATGQSGFDLYVEDGDEMKYNKTTRFHVDSVAYSEELFNSGERKLRTFIINFPLYNGVKSLKIGLERGATIQAPLPFSFPGKIVIYGTSITQGGCVSRPGMAYSNILSRKLDGQFVNLGFSGNGRGEPALAHLISQISDVGLIILDYEANASQTIIDTIDPFIQIIRDKKPDVPILIMSKIRYARETTGSEQYKHLISNRDFQKDLVESRKAEGDNNIYFLDGSSILGEDYFECTVDGVHPNDLGSMRIAEGLLEAIWSIFPDLQAKN